jgi:hypothetical protein
MNDKINTDLYEKNTFHLGISKKLYQPLVLKNTIKIVIFYDSPSSQQPSNGVNVF